MGKYISKILFITLLFVLNIYIFSINSFADSPVTSTDFSMAYEDEEIVKHAQKVKEMDKEIANYLFDEKTLLM